MKTRTILETTNEELSFMEVPGGPVDSEKGPLVVWRLERTTTRHKQDPQNQVENAPVINVQTGMGWEKEVTTSETNYWTAYVKHPPTPWNKSPNRGYLTLVREDHWAEFLEGALKHDIWYSDLLDENCKRINALIIDPEEAWSVVTSGIPVKVLNKYDYAHLLFDAEGVPLPQRISFDYINAQMSNEYYDLESVVEVLQKRDDITFYLNERQKTFKKDNSIIQEIPYYNRHEARTHCIKFDWHPSREDYKQIWLTGLKLEAPPQTKGIPWPSILPSDRAKIILETIFGIHQK